VVKLAREYQNEKGLIAEKYQQSIYSINRYLNELLFSRLAGKISKMAEDKQAEAPDLEALIARIELPSHLRAYAEKGGKSRNDIDLESILDGLPFPFFASLLLLAAHFAGTKVLFNTRPFLKEFSARFGKYQYPERALWLTDTFGDKNGVSSALQAMHREIKRRKLPIDLLVCSDTLENDDNLIVVKPLCEFRAPFYPDQPVRVPNFVEIHNLFQEREYDRVVCSTEGVMGAIGLYLKHAYSVPASFFIHTDWVMFSRKTLNFNKHNQNRIRRFLRVFYGAFDRVFVLNSDQRKWLTGRNMNFAEDKVRLTAHWADDIFRPEDVSRQDVFGIDNDRPVMLYVGRVSREKGVLELPRIYKTVKEAVPDAALAVVGQGPAYGQLKKELPEGYYFDWVPRERLPAVYSAADILVFPSKFDTFSCVALESLSCGLPVIAYNTKGPKDIIDDGACGYLVGNEEQMAKKIIAHLGDPRRRMDFRKAAVRRAENYDVNGIMERFAADIGF